MLLQTKLTVPYAAAGFLFSIVPFKITSRFQYNGGVAQKALEWNSAPYIVREQIKTFQNYLYLQP